MRCKVRRFLLLVFGLLLEVPGNAEGSDAWTDLLRRYRASWKEGYDEIPPQESVDYDEYPAEEEFSSWGEREMFEEDDKNVRGASLAFVFDSTGSMGDELNHVKSGAMKILRALRDHPDGPIYNYIWVPFNDPEIGPMTVTRDPKLFEQRMSDVVATGGGDCPEMCLGAIRKALGTSLPNSYVYVFTDAPPKDSDLLNEVLSLIQRKKAQVVFIVTDGCLDTEKDQYWVYERIAHTSSGQIYRLTTDEVKEVLKYVKVALQPHIVSLVSLNKPAPDKSHPDKVNVLVDDSLQQFTVSVSGINASIDVSDPKGFQVVGPPKLEKVLNLANIKVVNVKKPDRGAWSVLIKSDSNYTIRSTGLSKVNFNHGFSTKETFNMRETNYRPLKGAKSFVLIQTSNTDEVFNITTLDFVALTGDVLESLNLDQVNGRRGLYRGGSFVPPNEFFYLGVSGFSRDGSPIKRISSTAVSAQLPEKPIVTMKSRSVGKVNRPGKIDCRVESVVSVVVRWYKDGRYLEREETCSETCEVVLQFDKYSPEMEGKYLCQAKNLAGVDGKELLLTVTGEPPSVTVTSPVVASLGHKVLLNCSIKSELPYSVSWAQFTATDLRSGVFHPSSAGIKLENDSLLIDGVKAEDEGWYICVAKNAAGESQARILLIIKEPLSVTVTPSEVVYSEGDSARIVCSAVGKPQPRIEWLRNQQSVKDPAIVIEEVKDSLHFVIDYMKKRHAGVYTCNAANLEESVAANVRFIYKESPQIKAKEKSLIVKNGSEAIMKCTATGVPEPVIKWYKQDKQIDGEDERFEITEEGTLVIKSSDASDFGEYSCVAENDQGTAVDHIGLTVGSEPTFLQKPRSREIQLNHSGTISCSAFGVPLPEIRWTRSDGKEMNKSRISILPTGALKITKMMYEDGGRYICRAENVFGFISHEVSIKASGIATPTPDSATKLTEVKALAGNELVIPCGILLGNPPAKVTWFKDGVQLQEGVREWVVRDTGALVIFNATVDNEGNYFCHAENVVGQTSRSFDVFVSEIPTITAENGVNLKGKVGGHVVIPCPVSGHPVPRVTWTKNGLPLPISATIFQDEDASLIIKNLSEENSGVYVCTASNSVGSSSKETTVQVQVPPSFTDEVEDYPVNVVEGHMVVLNCNASATPEPEIEWFKDGKPFTQYGSQSTILRFFATTDHTGKFKCVVTNEAGSTFREFDVTILVPPEIFGRQDEKSIKAKTGIPITLICNVTGTPTPTILWQRNGMYLTQNASDIIITEDGSLLLTNVTKDSAGAYTCDAENLGGITQRTYYLQVNYPPTIINTRNDTINLTQGDEYSLDCLAEGNPKPSVIWKKNGFPIDDQYPDISILEDNSLLFLQVHMDIAGTYRCEAVNSEGRAYKDHEIRVLVPPSLVSDFRPTKLEVNEGDSLALTCPAILDGPPPNIQWIKDGRLLDPLLQERSDEAQMKLSPDQRTLTIVEAHPGDRGNYACVATNAIGRTDARFFVDILMTPHFEEFNHVAHRTILTGGEVVLNCSVSGNPQPKVVWRKENSSIAPHNIPGVHVTIDKKHLKIIDGRVSHTGTYVCLATNKVNTKEREFYVSVLEPPKLSGSLQKTIKVLKGDNINLECPSTGNPPPTFAWKKVQARTMTALNVTSDNLKILDAQIEDSGIYVCQVTNTAGTRTRYFDVSVLESPKLENRGINILNTRNPEPETKWRYKSRTNSQKKTSIRSIKPFNNVVYANLKKNLGGNYSLLAFNSAGVVENNFQVQITGSSTFSPEPGTDAGVEPVTVPRSFPVILKCPTHGVPTPLIVWLRGGDGKQNIQVHDNVVTSGTELWIKKSDFDNSGTYICVAENILGTSIHAFNVSVVDPPRRQGRLIEILDVYIGGTVTLRCKISGSLNVIYTWFHSLTPLQNDTDIIISGDGKTLFLRNLRWENSGPYKCNAENEVGAAEMHFIVKMNDNQQLNDQPPQIYSLKVHPHQPFRLTCLSMGDPPPRFVRWYKDGKELEGSAKDDSLTFSDFYIQFAAAALKDTGDYKCIMEKGRKELNFRVDVVVPGEWTRWTDWSECSVSCGSGVQTRSRRCESVKNDQREGNRIECTGNGIEEKVCLRTCQNAEWGEWSSCSAVCGEGTQKRCRVPDSGTRDEACEEKKCRGEICTVDGQWSEWSEWSPCSGSGTRNRSRVCDSLHLGKGCSGRAIETETCNGSKCEEAGRWLPWTEWSPCSRTCGRGHRKRVRKCEISTCGRLCTGNNHQVQKCLLRYCSNKTIPSSARVKVKGNLNGKPFQDRINVRIEKSSDEGQISTNLNPQLQQQDWFPYTPFLLSPVSWNMAYETENADNGLSLTDGTFLSESDIKFSTGEGLKVRHRGEGVNENGTFLVEIEVIGEVPMVEPRAVVAIDSIEQDLIQSGPRNLYAYTEANVTIDDRPLSYSWNNSIQYEADKGTMPYFVEKLTLKNISTVHDPTSRNVRYAAYSSIGKRSSQNRCPPGFLRNFKYMHCEDVDECKGRKSVCANDAICQNTLGSYRCVCPKGYKMAEAHCLDVNECSITADLCSHYCHNTPGSYQCSCPYGYYLGQDRRRCIELAFDYEGNQTLQSPPSETHYFHSDDDRYQEHKLANQVSCPPGYFYKSNKCKDIDECRNFPNICDVDETCLNLPGSFQCISAPCPKDYDRIESNKHCVKICSPENKCSRGAMVSESIIFYSAGLNLSHILPLDKIGQSTCNVVKTRYKVTDSSKYFQVRLSEGRHFLHPTEKLKRNTLYRVEVEAFSYGPKNELLYFSKLIIFLVVS